MNVTEKPLSEVVELVIDRRGITPLKLNSEWKESGVRTFSAKNIHTGIIVNEEQIRFIDNVTYERWMPQEIERGDILITSEAPFGNIYHWLSDEKIAVGQRLFAIRIKEEFDSSYIYYYLTTSGFQYELYKRCSGSTVTGLRQPELLKCQIRYPSFRTQQKISQILRDIDNKISNNTRINRTLEFMAKQLYDYWFVQFDFPDENGKPYKSSGGKMVWNEKLKREIPEGWEVKKLRK